MFTPKHWIKYCGNSSAMNDKRNKICFVIPHFGAIPGYLSYFILTAAYSHNVVDFLFITDQRQREKVPSPNFRFAFMTLAEFNARCSKKLGVHTAVVNAYKLCDLKPMYGLIFEDLLTQYTHWGHCDFDMIFGDVGKMLRANEWEKFDIFSVQQTYASGPFMVFRNEKHINHFFQNSPTWKEVFSETSYMGFDEAGDVIRELWKGKDIRDCVGKVYSMTHLLKNEQLLQRLNITVSMKNLITEEFVEGKEYVFKSGKIIRSPGEEEIFIYHYMNRKNLLLFNEWLPTWKMDTFTFNDKGFFSANRAALAAGLAVSLVARYWRRATKKIRNIMNAKNR